jgi:hypothetical protein
MWKLRSYWWAVAGSRAVVYGALGVLLLGYFIGVSSLRLLGKEGVKSFFSSEGLPGDGD